MLLTYVACTQLRQLLKASRRCSRTKDPKISSQQLSRPWRKQREHQTWLQAYLSCTRTLLQARWSKYSHVRKGGRPHVHSMHPVDDSVASSFFEFHQNVATSALTCPKMILCMCVYVCDREMQSSLYACAEPHSHHSSRPF